MDSLTFLEDPARGEPRPVYVIHGEEDFLKRQVLAALRLRILGEAEDAFGLSTHAGDKAVWRDIHSELQTLPFLSPHRLVVVENAEAFVSAHRSQLEKYLAAPAPSGVLVLEVKNWPATTKLYKLLDGPAAIACKSLTGPKLAEWCRLWASSQHQKQLLVPAAQLLVDLVGPDMGLLAQEIAKLAVYVGEAARISPEDVDRLVGNNRAENTFKIFDLIGKGDAAGALTLLDRLFGQGEDPLRLLGAFGWQLRRLAQALRRSTLGTPVATALAEVGFPPFKLRDCEQLLRHLGRRRLERLYDWLIEVDLGLKGASQLPPRTLLERLVVRLAVPNPATPRRATR
jgi:DNA polymerase-3 subunit delta